MCPCPCPCLALATCRRQRSTQTHLSTCLCAFSFPPHSLHYATHVRRVREGGNFACNFVSSFRLSSAQYQLKVLHRPKSLYFPHSHSSLACSASLCGFHTPSRPGRKHFLWRAGISCQVATGFGASSLWGSSQSPPSPPSVSTWSAISRAVCLFSGQCLVPFYGAHNSQCEWERER